MAGYKVQNFCFQNRLVLLTQLDPSSDLTNGNRVDGRVELALEIGDFIQHLPPRRVQIAQMFRLFIRRYGRNRRHPLGKQRERSSVDLICLGQSSNAVGELPRTEWIDDSNGDPGLVQNRMREPMVSACRLHCHQIDTMSGQFGGKGLNSLSVVSRSKVEADRVDENVQSILANIDPRKGA